MGVDSFPAAIAARLPMTIKSASNFRLPGAEVWKRVRQALVGCVRILLVTGGLCLGGSSAVLAQDLAIQEGDRIRIVFSGEPETEYQVDVTETRAGGVMVRPDAASPEQFVALESLMRLRVRESRTPSEGAWRGAGWGFLIGAATGAALGAAVNPDSGGFLDDPLASGIGMGAVLGLGGALTGIIVGARYPGEDWRERPVGSSSLSYRLRF